MYSDNESENSTLRFSRPRRLKSPKKVVVVPQYNPQYYMTEWEANLQNDDTTLQADKDKERNKKVILEYPSGVKLTIETDDIELIAKLLKL